MSTGRTYEAEVAGCVLRWYYDRSWRVWVVTHQTAKGDEGDQIGEAEYASRKEHIGGALRRLIRRHRDRIASGEAETVEPFDGTIYTLKLS